MKNGCIVLRNCKDSLSATDFSSVLDEFLLGGYPLDEVRFLSQNDDAPLREALPTLIDSCDNLLLLLPKSLLLAGKTLCDELGVGEFFQGTAAGAGFYTKEGKTLFLLASDDRENGAKYAKEMCVPYLNQKYNVRFDRMTLRLIGAAEGAVANTILDARRMCADKIRFQRRRKYDEDVIDVLYDNSVPKMTVDDVMRLFAQSFADNLYALEDISIEKQLVQLLTVRGKRISVAESFTGGGIARRITSVSGASKVYFEGLNTYAEEAKMKRLGVREYTLRMNGAVSDQTAYEMAAGLIATGDCDVSVATTGIAGPKSDRTDAPVGLAYIAVGAKESVFVYQYKFNGTRDEIVEQAINYALFQAYKHLKTV